MFRFVLICLSVAFVAGQARTQQPVFTDVFLPNQDGFPSIRIPAIVATKQGTLLAIAEGRAANADQAKNKIVLKRSTDLGKTWSQLQIIAEDGDKSLNNPCVVVEQNSGRILLMYQVYPVGIAERNSKIQTGYESDLIIRNFLITSDDDGKTWSTPREVTRGTKRPESATTLASGPGVGIQLRYGKHAGRILIPFNEGPFGVWNVYAAYSDDQGATWQTGGNVPDRLETNPLGKTTSKINEAQLVELSDGSIRLNMRRWAGKALRKTSVSKDGGLTWSAVADVPEQVDPSCMASIIRYDDPTGTVNATRKTLLFSGPQSTKRENGTIFLSNDDGATWPVQRVLTKDAFAYSCLAVLPDGSIGCLFEADGMKTIKLARFTIDWLTDPANR